MDQKVRSFLPAGPDICFLDGLHRFEFLLRDFINTEASCHRNSIILLHDCLPLNARMTERAYRVDEAESEWTRHAWTGDVWRMLPTLKKYRPEMRVLLLDCSPTGLVACTGLDPTSSVLRESYHAIVDEMMSKSLEDFGLDRLWTMFPMLDSRKMVQNPQDVTAIFNLR